MNESEIRRPMYDDLDGDGGLTRSQEGVPHVSVDEDPRPGRRRIRQTRGLVATGVASAVATVVLGLAGCGEHTPTTDASSGPLIPGSAADGRGLLTPLVAPASLLDVHRRGFHLTPLPGFEPQGPETGWAIDTDGQTQSLWWAEIADTVTVNVRYEGARPPWGGYFDTSGWPHREKVMIHGAVGYYYDEPRGRYGIGGAFAALVAWEYAPDSMAYVAAHSDRRDPGRERLRAGLIQVAEAVRPGGEPVRVPIRTNNFPRSLPPVSHPSGVHRATSGTPAVDFGPHLTVSVTPSGTLACVPPPDGGGVETFTYRGHPGCLSGYGATDQPPRGTSFNYLDAISLELGDTVRTATIVRNDYIDFGTAPEYPIRDLKRALAGLTVAPLDDQSTWFDLRTALGGGKAARGS